MKCNVVGAVLVVFFSFSIHALSLSGSAFNESLGGSSVAYPWSVNQSVMINPAYPGIVKCYAGNSFFNFNYFVSQDRKDLHSYSWNVTFAGVSYSHIQNRYLDINNKTITFSRSFDQLPFGEMLSIGTSFRWQESAGDVDEGIDVGFLMMARDNLAIGYTWKNVMAPEINGAPEPWSMIIGAGYKPMEKIGLTVNAHLYDDDDSQVSGGVEYNLKDFLSLRVGYTADSRWVVGKSVSIKGYMLSLSYEFARKGYDDNTLSISFSTGKYNYSPGWFTPDDAPSDDDDYSEEE